MGSINGYGLGIGDGDWDSMGLGLRFDHVVSPKVFFFSGSGGWVWVLPEDWRSMGF